MALCAPSGHSKTTYGYDKDALKYLNKFSWVMAVAHSRTPQMSEIFVVNNFVIVWLLRKLRKYCTKKIWHHTVHTYTDISSIGGYFIISMFSFYSFQLTVSSTTEVVLSTFLSDESLFVWLNCDVIGSLTYRRLVFR